MSKSITAVRFAVVPEALLFDQKITTTEFALLAAVRFHDWDGKGCWPSNDTLAKACRVKAEDPDAVIRKLLRRLKRDGYVEVETVTRSKANPTGRILRIPGDPSERRVHPDLQDRVSQPPPGSTGPGQPDLQDRVNPDLKIRGIDPFQTDSEKSSSGDDDSGSPGRGEDKTAVVVERIADRTRKAFRERPKAARKIVEKIPRWLERLDGVVPDPGSALEAWIVKASIAPETGREAGYVDSCVYNAVNPTTKAPPPSTSSKPVGEVIDRYKAEERSVEAASALLDARWQELAEYERAEIIRHVLAEEPGLRRWKSLLHARCLAEMDKRYPAPAYMAMA